MHAARAASNMIRDYIQRLNEELPEAEFKYGYTGNWVSPTADFRQHSIFTQVPTGEDRSIPPKRFKFNLYGDPVDHIREIESDRFIAWLTKVKEAIGSSSQKWWHHRIHANDCPKCGSHNYNRGWSSILDCEVLICCRCDHRYPDRNKGR